MTIWQDYVVYDENYDKIEFFHTSDDAADYIASQAEADGMSADDMYDRYRVYEAKDVGFTAEVRITVTIP